APRRVDDGLDAARAAGRHAAAIADKCPQARIGAALPRSDPSGLILLCVRSPEIETALTPAVPVLKPDGAVVCLQNGFPEERVAKLVGMQRVLGAVIGWSATMTEPGEYVVTGGGKFTLGGASPRLEHARLVLQDAFPVRVAHNLQSAGRTAIAMNWANTTRGAVSRTS